jgi:peroxiredoxin Q/BCP
MTATLVDVGDRAPAFTLPDADGTPVSLSDFAGTSVILYCYPAAMTPGCTTQACDFTAARAQLEPAGYQVIGLSPDAPEKLARFRAKESLSVTLLSDPDHRVLAEYGAWGPRTLYGRTVEGVIRSTFVVDGSGILQLVRRNVKATGHVGRVLRDLGLTA